LEKIPQASWPGRSAWASPKEVVANATAAVSRPHGPAMFQLRRLVPQSGGLLHCAEMKLVALVLAQTSTLALTSASA
jgi:hypothetical protein